MQEAVSTYNYLKLISLINFDLWDTKRYTSKSITSSFPIVELGSCINEENKKYKLYEEENKVFGILGVNNKEGIFDAYTQKGKDINQAYKKMEVGWLAYNPYRINVGSIGIRLIEHKNEYISPAYVVFSCNENLLPEFLFLLFKTDTFNKIVNESTTGSVRQNLTIDILKKLKIPLPSLTEQISIINAYNSKIAEAQVLQNEANNLEIKIEEYLFEELNIAKTDKRRNNRALSYIGFNDIEKWGVEYILGSSSINLLKSLNYPNKKLSEIVDINPTTKLPKENITISFVPMESVSDEYGEITELKEKKISESKGYTKFQDGDIIWARITPCMQNGKSAIVNRLKNNFGCGSTEFHVIRNTKSNIDTNYLYHILRLKTVLNNAMSHFTGSAGQQRVPKSFLEDLIIPVPPIDIQKNLSENLYQLKHLKKDRELQAVILKNQAKESIEKKIFG